MAMKKKHSMDFVFVMALIAVFIACALLVSVFCADVFKSTSAMTETNYNNRTSVMYVSEKIRQNDIADSVRVDKFEGSDALVLSARGEGEGYETWIFVSEGNLYEAMIERGTKISISAAQEIMPLKSMTLEKQISGSKVSGVGLINASFVDDNDVSSSVLLPINSNQGGA